MEATASWGNEQQGRRTWLLDEHVLGLSSQKRKSLAASKRDMASAQCSKDCNIAALETIISSRKMLTGLDNGQAVDGNIWSV
jgi:hypothetical protein